MLHDTIIVTLICSYRQAQAAVLQAIPKLSKLGIQTKRPMDYFAEMAKSDNQMQKVCVIFKNGNYLDFYYVVTKPVFIVPINRFEKSYLVNKMLWKDPRS